MIFRQRVSQWCALHGNLFGVVPVIVHQMAKVGSTSIVAALSEAGVPVWQVHRMDAGHLDEMRARRRALGWIELPLPAHDVLGLRIRRELLDRGGRARIITLVRDPIARNLSSYFEHLDAIWHQCDAHASVSTAELIRGFHERFPHEEPLTWFDDEMLPATGIDVYASPFPSTGHLTLRNGTLDLLILKTELTNAEKSAALRGFLDLPSLRVTSVNTTEQKAKGDVYRQFVETIRFEDAQLDAMLESRFARHFYSRDELDAMRKRYSW